MQVHSLPTDFKNNTGEIYLHYYESDKLSVKNKVTLELNLFSFLLEGEKEAHFNNSSLRIDNTKALLLSSGNCLMTEKISSKNKYRSILFFFDNNKTQAFITKYAHLIPKHTNKDEHQPVLAFTKDDFIISYLNQLEHFLKSGIIPAKEMLQLKFEELMLYMADKYPDIFLSFIAKSNINSIDHFFKATIESNINNNLSLQELAFLCNTSLSTFKRQFEKLYGVAPRKWLHEKRMQQAAFKLKHENARPAEIYYEFGYENLSGFIQAFKKEFGKTPGEYGKVEGLGHKV
ncbi:helix-turn-helix domain-containing protein [Chitinophagaceae bacterium LWZ2-11]